MMRPNGAADQPPPDSSRQRRRAMAAKPRGGAKRSREAARWQASEVGFIRG
jgi:hypothetical protein